VIDLINKANSLNYEPEDPFEWLAYIEAQASTGNLDEAEKLSTKIFVQDKRIRGGLCQLWKRVQDDQPARSDADPRVVEILSKFQCAR
jgi:hypothetical protein